MTGYVNHLIELGSKSLAQGVPIIADSLSLLNPGISKELLSLLTQKNGFYVFESALHVFPSAGTKVEIGLNDWNSPDLWVEDYKGMASKCFFFAEDIFGNQFCIRSDGIHMFNAETAELEYLAADIEGWAKVIIDDYEFLTGYPIAHAWQKAKGKLPEGYRLVPKIPFIAGGEFEIGNLIIMDSINAMKFRANIAVQVCNLPDGAQFKWKIVD